MPSTLVVRGAREHNLKNVSIELPRDQLIVFTGLSGSGKSSLAFDTIYAEGQRRYVESLSSYARQFLGQMDKPDVDFIEGLSPAISIDQKSASRNPRSTVGTITEIYDYLRLLYARIGLPHCPNCGRLVTRQSPQQIVDRLSDLPEGTRFQVLAPVVRGRKGEYSALLDELAKQGYARAHVDGELIELSERTSLELARYEQHTIEVVVDRLVRRDGIERRLTDSIETALRLGEGIAEILLMADAPSAKASKGKGAGKPAAAKARSAAAKAAAADAGEDGMTDGDSEEVGGDTGTPRANRCSLSPSTWRAFTAVFRSTNWRRGAFPSTHLSGRAPRATVSAPASRSIPIWSCRTRISRFLTVRSLPGRERAPSTSRVC